MQQRRLHQVERRDEEYAEPQREHDRAGLIRRTVEIGHTLPKDVRPPRAWHPTGQRGQCARREPQHTKRDADPCARRESQSHGRRAQHGDRDDGGPDHCRDDPRGGIAGDSRREVRSPRLDMAPQRLQRRDPAQREQRPEREEERDPESGAESEEYGPRHDVNRHIDRQEIVNGDRQRELDGDPERDADQRADQPHGCRLRDIDHQHLGAGGAQTPEDGGGFDLSRDEGGDPAGDPDAAEQERHHSDDPQEIGQSLDRVGEIDFGVDHRLNPHVLGG